MRYFPVALPFLLFFAIFLVVLIIAIEVGVLRYAYDIMGVGRRHMLARGYYGSREDRDDSWPLKYWSE